jgi:hypothetical protein
MKYRVCDAVTFDGMFSEEECKDIIALGKGAIMEKAKLQHTDGNWRVGRGRNCSLAWIGRDVPGASWVFQRFSYIFNKITDENYGFRIRPPVALQFTEYKMLQNYDWHFDNGAENDVRLLTCVVNLKNAVWGGGTQIKANNWVDGDKANNIGAGTFFPCYLLHRAKKVILGTRYSLVGWATSRSLQ